MRPTPPSRFAPIVLLLACAHAAPSKPPPIPPEQRLVVVISIDGLPAYSFADPKMPAPTLRRLAREGAQAAGMSVVNPSVTWPNHTTLATGVSPARHGVLFNGRLMRGQPGEPVRVEQMDRSQLVRVQTAYDLAHARGLRTAQVDWIPPQIDGTISFAFPERPTPAGAMEQEMVGAGLLSAIDVETFRQGNGPWRDVVWTQAAAHIIRAKKPHLLYFHLLNLDGIHHRMGPGTAYGLTAIALADARVRDVVDAIEEAGLAGRATVFVTSDHGFKTVKRQIRPNAAFREKGWLASTLGKITTADVQIIPEGGSAMLYFTRPERKEELLPLVRELCAGLEGVERVVGPEDFAALGLPRPEDNDQMADLVLFAKTGYAFAATAEGEPVVDAPDEQKGTHGYIATDPEMDATFIAWGYGIKRGARPERVRNLDVAPTVARLLGFSLDGVEGRVLTEILTE